MNKLKSTLLSVGTASFLILNGCVGYTFNSDTLGFPGKKIPTSEERLNPIDKIFFIPESIGHGLVETCSTTWYTAKKDGFVKGPLYAPFNLTEGLVNTALDTSLNVILWPPLEIYEAISEKTWNKPYMPFTKSMRKAASLRTKN